MTEYLVKQNRALKEKRCISFVSSWGPSQTLLPSHYSYGSATGGLRHSHIMAIQVFAIVFKQVVTYI